MESAHLVNVLGALSLAIATEMEEAIAAASDLSEREMAALTTLANWADGRSIEVLRVASGLSQPGSARLVDRLETAGLVRRTSDTTDGRVTAVHVTRRGRGAVTRGRRARAEVLNRWLQDLTDEEVGAMSSLVDRLLRAAHEASADPMALGTRVCRLCDVAACAWPEKCPTLPD